MKSKPPAFPLPARYSYQGETLAGGQGEVYMCLDANLDRRVAIKALHKVARYPALLREVAARAKIKSKHVVEMYELILDDKGVPIALVLEYVPGSSLQDKATIPGGLEDRLRLLYQIACGLKEIHAAGVIHRDIKPDNIKVDGAGILRIFDLGIANVDAEGASTVGAAGTMVYRAPELYGTPPIDVTFAVDIYALGVIAWHLLVGNFPNELTQIPPQHTGAPPSLQTAANGLGSIAVILNACLAKDPAGRPSAGDLVLALNGALTDGRQRGIFTYGEKSWELSKPGTVTSLTIGAQWGIKIAYESTAFVVREFTGDVYVNNSVAKVGQMVPKSCVLTFGAPDLGSRRAFLPFDSAQPEIVL